MRRMMLGHSSREHWEERARVLDGYNTPEEGTLALLRAERLHHSIWEPAAGFHHMARVLREHGHDVFASDVHRWHRRTDAVRDFRECVALPRHFRRHGCDVVTNPPFVLAREFAEYALKLLRPGDRCCLLLRLQFLEGNKRLTFFRRHPPARVHVFSYRLPMMHRFGYDGKLGGSAMAYAWFVWVKGYRGPTELRWLARPN